MSARRYSQRFSRRFSILTMIFLAGVLVACEPTVKVQAPEKPITINLNIKLDAEVRVKLEEQAKEDIKKNPNIF